MTFKLYFLYAFRAIVRFQMFTSSLQNLKKKKFNDACNNNNNNNNNNLISLKRQLNSVTNNFSLSMHK